MILDIVGLSKSRTIVELEFHRTDLLDPRRIANSNLRPLTQLRRVHFVNYRLITMHTVAKYLPSYLPDFEIVFTCGKPEIAELNGESGHGAILCYLFMWRMKRPIKFTGNLQYETRFGNMIEYYAGSTADDWYDFINRAYPEDDNWSQEDRELLRNANGGQFVLGSNAASLQEELSSCHLVMPGLCFPKARRNKHGAALYHLYLWRKYRPNSDQPGFEIAFTSRRPEIRELNGESWHGAVLCDLYLWRKNRPHKFIDNLLLDTRFRSYIEHYVSSNEDDWYEFVNRPYPSDSDEDHSLLRAFNGGSLVKGSNAAAFQECFSCELSMRGLCFPFPQS